jgi:hypothetical protein
MSAMAPASRRAFAVSIAITALALVGCGKHSYAVAVGPRDFSAHPSVARVEEQPARLYAISDVHGGYDRMIALLAKHGLVAPGPASPAQATWTGGDATLVVTGDLIDKGDHGLEVLDALMALERGAAASGGRLLVLAGNHEAEFFVDPENSKASAFDDELTSDGITPDAIASGADPRGAWLRNLPLAARVGRFFFSHAGDTHGRSLDALEQVLDRALLDNGYADPELTGDASILESRSWYDGDATIALTYAQAVGAEHIIFGHDPSALGPKGTIATAQAHALLRIDCGMSPAVDYSEGEILFVHDEGGADHADALLADGSKNSLF